jgi:LysR family transcriptional regulator, glycine cleavage system transcriptional activator
MKRNLPTLPSLLAFETAARHGRMTIAAAELNITPGAVSKQIKKLEEWLGLALFEGTKNNPKLTATGEILQSKLSTAFDQVEAAVTVAKRQTSLSVSVACYNTLAAKWLLPRLPAFSVLQPDIDIHLSATTDIDKARLSHSDVIILAEPNRTKDDNDVLRRHLFDEYLGPVLSPKLLGEKSIASINSLNKFPILKTKSRSDAWDIWASSNPAEGHTNNRIHAKHEYPHYYLTIEAALRGLGVCIAPWHLVFEDIESERLTAPLGFTKTKLHYVALCEFDAKQTVHLFCDWLAKEASQLPIPIDRTQSD